MRAARLRNLRKALGRWPETPMGIRTVVTGTIEADGYVIENIVYESRPGEWVTANLYRPAKLPVSIPGIIISHSHHAPKHQGELQDMGATWARAGCYVLAPDHFGHGERGQHGFQSAADYPREFRPSRQDYYFRYDSSIQLYLVGESLMGTLARDLMRGVDVLLERKGIDKERIILLGSVAGGGDPCAVTAALDERIACAVPFNFGGPQPETRYPLPGDAETWFNYAGGGSWESTRNLAWSARPGQTCLPWEIVSAIAPRRLVYGHEFAWDRERDPVWRRLERVWELQGAQSNLAFAHGRGGLTGQAPAASHCNNIGTLHRANIHEAFARWFGIRPVEYSRPKPANQLVAMTAAARDQLRPRMLQELLATEVDTSLAAARSARDRLPPAEARRQLQSQVTARLGDVAASPVRVVGTDTTTVDGTEMKIAVERLRLKTERNLELPLIVVSASGMKAARQPAVLALAQSGKAGILKHRAIELARLVRSGCVVCLPDIRNVGETAGDDSRGQFSASTDRAASGLMVGDPLVAQQLRDARTVLAYLRGRDDIDPGRIAVWGVSTASANADATNLRTPRRIDGRPRDVEPLGGHLALLLGLYEEGLAAVCVDRGVVAFRGALESPFVYVPLESVVPGILVTADMPDLAAAIAPRPLMLCGSVDAQNRVVSKESVLRAHEWTAKVFRDQQSVEKLTISVDDSSAAWLVSQLK